jgi:hypothetical protein
MQGTVLLRSVLRLLVTANIPSSLIFMDAIRSSETWVLTKTTWRNIPEGGILHNDLGTRITGYIKIALNLY